MNNSPLPEGREIHKPYCLVVCEENAHRAIYHASKPLSGCWAVFVHHSQALGEWIATEGIFVSDLMRDSNLKRIWYTKDLYKP